MEPADGELNPADQDEPPVENERKFAAPIGALGELAGFIQLEGQDSDGIWRKFSTIDVAEREGHRLHIIVKELIAFLLDGMYFSDLTDELRLKELTVREATKSQDYVIAQLTDYVKRTCKERMKYRNFIFTVLLGAELGREGTVIVDAIAALGKRYDWALTRLTKTSMDVAEGEDAVAKLVAKIVKTLTADLVAKLGALAPWMPLAEQTVLVGKVVRADLKERSIM